MKPIRWYEWLYEINDENVVINCKTKRVIKLILKDMWYYCVWLSKNKIRKQYYVHRLIWDAYFWLEEWKEINHIDANKLNNKITNLEQITHSDNMRHAKVNNLMNWCKYSKNWKAKKVYQYTKSWAFVKEWETASLVYDTLWIWQQSVSKCARLEIPSAWWYIWRYKKIA